MSNIVGISRPQFVENLVHILGIKLGQGKCAVPKKTLSNQYTSTNRHCEEQAVPRNDERRMGQFYFDANSFAIDFALSANRINSDR